MESTLLIIWLSLMINKSKVNLKARKVSSLNLKVPSTISWISTTCSSMPKTTTGQRRFSMVSAPSSIWTNNTTRGLLKNLTQNKINRQLRNISMIHVRWMTTSKDWKLSDACKSSLSSPERQSKSQTQWARWKSYREWWLSNTDHAMCSSDYTIFQIGATSSLPYLTSSGSNLYRHSASCHTCVIYLNSKI